MRIPPSVPQKSAIAIQISEPYPLLDEGTYQAQCISASVGWMKSFQCWKVILKFALPDYGGRPYTGTLCKFLNAGKNPDAPFAGKRSDLHRLLVAMNGGPLVSASMDLNAFVGTWFDIEVVTVTRNCKEQPLTPQEQYSTIRTLQPSNLPTYQPTSADNSLTSQPINLLTHQPSNLATDQPSQPNNLLRHGVSYRNSCDSTREQPKPKRFARRR